MYDGWEWQTCIAPGGKVQRDMRTWASSKSFSQGFWPCHSTDRASGTFSAFAVNCGKNVAVRKIANARTENLFMSVLLFSLVGHGRTERLRGLEIDDQLNSLRALARRERPRCRRAAEQRDELPALYRCNHSITSSARASSVAGSSRPSALAVFRLITSSYLVGACTGRSAGFSPLRIRSRTAA